MNIITTRTGKIFSDPIRKLEFLSVGDYGKEANIKAEFLGLHDKIYEVEHKPVNLQEKWVITISTQKGCPMACNMCECPSFGYYGNASMEDLVWQVRTALMNEKIKETARLNVHFARMGEPTLNPIVLDFAKKYLRSIVLSSVRAQTVHPVISTMVPKHDAAWKFIQEWVKIKNWNYDGEAGLQLSINSTDDAQREQMFGGMASSLESISSMCDFLPYPVGRKYTLNFAVTKDSIVDANRLTKLFDKDKFIVKITPIHRTTTAIANGFDIDSTYKNYDVYEQFEKPLVDLGWDVLVFIPSKEEDEDRITCGNTFLSDKEEV